MKFFIHFNIFLSFLYFIFDILFFELPIYQLSDHDTIHEYYKSIDLNFLH